MAERLWRLKKSAGDPSYAEMAAMGAAASKSSLAAAAQGRTLPSWGTTWEFVRVLAVDRLALDPVETEREWRAHWQQARDAMTAAEDAEEWGEVEPGAAPEGPHAGFSVDPMTDASAADPRTPGGQGGPGGPGGPGAPGGQGGMGAQGGLGAPGMPGAPGGPAAPGMGGPGASGMPGAGPGAAAAFESGVPGAGSGPAGGQGAGSPYGPGAGAPGGPGAGGDNTAWPAGAWPGGESSQGWNTPHGFDGDDGGPPTDPGAGAPPPNAAAAAAAPPPKKRRFPYWTLAAAAVAMIVIGGGVYVAWPSSDDEAKQPPVTPSVIPIPKPKDDSTFIKDITYPDGTLVKAGSTFEKVWRLRNSGSVQWSNRQLIQIGNSPCSAPKHVPIPETVPGHMVDVRVRVRAANRPTKCKIFFKMADSAGRILMPTKRPIFLYVQVGHL